MNEPSLLIAVVMNKEGIKVYCFFVQNKKGKN